MQSCATRFLFAALVAAMPVQPVRADPIVVGAPGNSATCIPFGCKDVDRYQQVYSAALFPGVFTISAIVFPYTLDQISNAIDPAEYTIRLSTTSSEVARLNSVDMGSNVGRDVSVVFSGTLAGEVPRGGSLAFTLPVSFTWRTASREGSTSSTLSSGERLNGCSSEVARYSIRHISRSSQRLP